jgi:uncharacterized protein YjeT (DUF2065 family)
MSIIALSQQCDKLEIRSIFAYSPTPLTVKNTVLTFVFCFFCLVLIASGALQCFAPPKLKALQDKLRPRGDWSGSALGGYFERLRERQATRPSVFYRLSGLALMAMGFLMLGFALGLFRR